MYPNTAPDFDRSVYETPEQAAVVEDRKAMGYDCWPEDHGNVWVCVKDRHTLRINVLGYDGHLPKGSL